MDRSTSFKIDWNFPEPRKGLKGFIDNLVGPGATKAELLLQFGFAGAMAIGALVYGLFYSSWTMLQIIVVTYLLFDISGGIATNATSSAKRWWHRAERQHQRNDVKFILMHFYMPLLITLAFFPSRWDFFLWSYGYLIFALFAITSFPQYLRRPVAFMVYTISLFLPLLVSVPNGLLWFLPMFYLKLLLSHLLIEEPYRPNNQ